MMTLPDSQFKADAESSGANIDFKRILYQGLRFWYLVVLILTLSLVAAFLHNRYAVRIYPVTASIIIKEEGESSEAKFLYNNALVSGVKNYLNELYIIKSYPLIRNTIDALGFQTSFYKEGNVLTTELYKYLPIKVSTIDDSQNTNHQFYFEVVDENRFRLSPMGSNDVKPDGGVTYHFNDTIQFMNLKAVFYKDGTTSLNDYRGQRLLFIHTSIDQLVASYMGRLNASWAEEGAGVIYLSINGANPAKEIDFLTEFVRQYQIYDYEKKNLVASKTIEFINLQLSGIADSLHKAELRLETFKNRNIITDLGTEAQRLYEKMEGLDLQKTELVMHNRYYKYLDEYLREGKGLDQIILPTAVGLNDPMLAKLVDEMMSGQAIVSTYAKSKENVLLKEKLKIIEGIKSKILESLAGLKQIDKIKKEFIDAEIATIERGLVKLPVEERQLASIQRDYSLMEGLYVFLLQRRAEAGISKASASSNITMVNPPSSADGPITPKTGQNYLFAAVVGLGIPLSVLFLLEVFNTRVQSREDIEKLTSIPFIGGIGHKKTGLDVLNSPKSAIAESFRALRSNLNYFLNKREKAVFMVTSSISGEGKTFTSINLASILSLSGKRILIVGADMRRPKIYSDFGLANDIGLSSYLAGIADFNSVIQETSYNGIHLISGGPVPPNPSELLMGARMDELISIAKSEYDYVVIDTPPLAIVTDAFTLSAYADHTLFLIRQNVTPKALVKTVNDFYLEGKLKNVSIVFNDIYRSGPGYGYGYEYGYGYTYGSKNGYGYYS